MGTARPVPTDGTVDQEADTAESTNEAITVPLNEETAATHHLITLLYPPDTPKKLSDKFPRGRITKQSGQKVLMGRSKELDILLNDEHMPRTFMELWCENEPRDSATEEAGAQGGPKWFVRNKNAKKPVRIHSHVSGNSTRSSLKLKAEELKEIQDSCELKLEGLTFVVKLQDGDLNTGDFELEIRPLREGYPTMPNRQNSFSSSSGSGNSDIPGSAAELAQRQQNSCCSCSHHGQPHPSTPAFFGTPHPDPNLGNMPIQNLTQLVQNLSVQGSRGSSMQASSPQPNAGLSSCAHCGHSSQGTVQVVLVPVNTAASGALPNAMPATGQDPYAVSFPAPGSQTLPRGGSLPQTTNPPGLRQPHSSPSPNQHLLHPGLPTNEQLTQGALTSPAPSAPSGDGGGVAAVAELGFSSLQVPSYSSYQGTQSNIQQNQQYSSSLNQLPSFAQPAHLSPGRLYGPTSMPEQRGQEPSDLNYGGNQMAYYQHFVAQQQRNQQLQQGTVAVQPESAMFQQVQQQLPRLPQQPQPMDTSTPVYTFTDLESSNVLPAAPPASVLQTLGIPTQATSLSPVQVTSETPANSVLGSQGWDSGFSYSAAAVGSLAAGHSNQPAQGAGLLPSGIRSAVTVNEVRTGPAQHYQQVAATHLSSFPGSLLPGQNLGHMAPVGSAGPLHSGQNSSHLTSASSAGLLQPGQIAGYMAPAASGGPVHPGQNTGHMAPAGSTGPVHPGQNTGHMAPAGSARPGAVSSTLTAPSSNGNFVHLRMHEGIGPTPPPSSDFSTLSSDRLFDLQARGVGLHGDGRSGREPGEDDERQPEEHDDQQ